MEKNRTSKLCMQLIVLTMFSVITFLAATSAIADVFVDNGGPGSSPVSGTWLESSGLNSYGTTSVYARPSASYSWQMSGQPAGDYEVLMWWTSYSNRGTAISVDINSDGGTDSRSVNQRNDGGVWVSLGTFTFSGSGSVTIHASTETMPDGRYVTTCADAVWFRQVSGDSLPIIIDNNNPGTTSSTGLWQNSGGLNSYGTTSVYARPDATYTWQFDSHPSGFYEVSMWWTEFSNRGTNITVDINSNDGMNSVPIDQRVSGGQWVVLGTYPFAGSGNVTIHASDERMPDGRFVTTCADAVRFRYVGPISSGIDEDGDGFTSDVDCNDTNPLIYPGATEVCDGVDNNCDAVIDEGFDVDGDGFTTCAGDCNDADAAVHPGAAEICDAIDNNCDGSIDDFADGDGDGFTICTGDCNDANPAVYPGAVEVCDGVDNNCDAVIDEGFDIDGDGYTTCTGDCNDADAAVYPGAVEICDGIDNNCDGNIDDFGDGDGDGFTVCAGDCNDANSAVYPGATEVCDGIDNNCDAVIDEGFDVDGDGFITCMGDCNDADAAVHPGAIEICDGIDNNCDGSIDDFADGDGDGFTVCTGDCNDANPAIYPGAAEVCDGIDNNCDAIVDEGFDVDGDGFTTCAGDCNDAAAAIYPGATEICGDGIDQDCSGGDLSCEPPADIIIDNNAPGTTSLTGLWQNSSGVNSYGTLSIYARPQATYTWQYNSQPPGVYEVSMRWTEYSNRGTAINVDIHSIDGTATVPVNQRTNGGQWISLGAYPFGGSGSVIIRASSQTMPDGTFVTTCADAVRFHYVSALPVITDPPTAAFTVDKTHGAAPLMVQFTDRSTNSPVSWSWDFGDGSTSVEENPFHEYTSNGNFTVSLTASNNNGSDTVTKTDLIQIVAASENIYVLDGYGTTTPIFPLITSVVASMGGIEINPGVWSYTNPVKGITYYIQERSSVAGARASFMEEDAHVIYGGHSNYGLGMAFLNDTYPVRYFDDPLFLVTGTDMMSPDIPGMKYSQAYPNWRPFKRDGTSAIMPYDFTGGTPPYNYYLTYQAPGDPTYYRIEKPDGNYWERFPDSKAPAWYSPVGAKPDPVANPEYFITNPDPDHNRCEFVGQWSRRAPIPEENTGFMGFDFQYHQPGSGSNKAIFTLMVRDPGMYAVIATWQAEAQNATNAVFSINHSGLTGPTPANVEVNQQVTAGMNILGVYYFNYGTNKVELSDLANGVVVADVVALMPLGNPTGFLQAEFLADVVTGIEPLVVQFSDYTTSYGDPVDPALTAWEWDFGDGTISSEENPLHTYTEPGLFTVTLTVTDANGAQSTEIKEEFVAVGISPSLQAEFKANWIYGWTQTLIHFQDQSSGDITNWHWDFGDGNTSNEQNPQHAFRSTGTFTVTLTVTDASGTDIKVKSDYIHNITSMIIIDNTFEYKPHYYSTYRGRDIGVVIQDASDVNINSDELKYSRLFYNSCFTGKYFLGNFNRGVVYFTHANSREPRPEGIYIRRYLEGHTDEEIKAYLNEITYEDDANTIQYGLYDYYDFTRLPPSVR